MKDTERHDRIRFSRFPGLHADRPVKTVSFVVRLSRELSGDITGIVERVATGEKVRFRGCDAVGSVIADLFAEEETR